MTMSMSPPKRVASGMMATATTPHVVFVYGTLKRGFFNHDAVLLPGILALREFETAAAAASAAADGREKRQAQQQSDTARGPRPTGDCPAYCRDLRLDATVRGAVLFADAYFIPYLILPDRGDSNREADAPAAAGEVCGEIYGVNDEMLRRLDDLEGVDRGRYVRSSVAARVDNGDEVDAFVYHLAETPPVVASVLRRENGSGALGGELEEEGEVAVVDRGASRGASAAASSVSAGGEGEVEGEVEGAEAIRFLASYRLDEHRRSYVPPGGGRDESRYRSWGGYV